MKFPEDLSKRDIAFHSFEDAVKVAEILLKNSYCVMFSLEEDLVILHYEWTENFADRNQMIFRNRNDYEHEMEQYLNGGMDEDNEDNEDDDF